MTAAERVKALITELIVAGGWSRIDRDIADPIITRAIAAAEDAALERAAEYFDSKPKGPRGGECHYAASVVAARIRALKHNAGAK